MPIWGWVCTGLMVAFVAFVVYCLIRNGMDEKRIRREGRQLVAYIVQANTALYRQGGGNSPAQVLITFDETIPNVHEYLGDLAARVAALK